MELQAPILGLGGWWYATHTVSRHLDDRAAMFKDAGLTEEGQTPTARNENYTLGSSKFATYRRTGTGVRNEPVEIPRTADRQLRSPPPHVTPALHVCLPC